MRTHRFLLLIALPLLTAARAAGVPSAPGKVAGRGSLPAKIHLPLADNQASLEKSLLEVAPTLRLQALRAALSSWSALREEISRPLLTVIDYSLPSTAKRMWVFDLASHRLLFHELVAHGRNTGEDLARAFSNEEGSLMTSLGAFVTSTTYTGKNGYSMRLRGMDPRLNGRAETRTIVVHGAPYVGEEVARKLGRLGRSHGCPALRPAIARTLIDEIKDGTVLFAWHPSIDGSRESGGPVPTVAVRGEPAGRTLSR